jgi:hypothetical protein
MIATPENQNLLGKNENLFRFAVNPHGKNKDWDFKILAGKFQDTEGTLEDVIQHIKQGHALCAGLLNGQWRNKTNFAGSSWVLSEIDNSTLLKDENGKAIIGPEGKGIKTYQHQMTLDEAIADPFIRSSCALIYTTPSHTPDWHRFRLVWRLPEFVEDIDTYEALVRLLLEQLPHDPACKDGVRVFYGNTNAEFPLINADAFLPADWIEIAQSKAEHAKQEQAERLQLIEARREAFQSIAHDEGWDTDVLIQQALHLIPPRQFGSGNYDECRQVLMALVDHYGPVEAEAIAEEWSPSIKGTTWNIRAKIKSFKRTGVTIGSLFHIAQQYGFRFPQRQLADPSEPHQRDYEQVIRQQEEQELVKQAQEQDHLLQKITQLFKGFGVSHELSTTQKTGQAENTTTAALDPAQVYSRSRARISRRRRVPTEQQKQALGVLLGGNRSTLRRLRKYWQIPQHLDRNRQKLRAVKVYQPGERLHTWQAAIAQGYRYILDISLPGTGKSYDTGNLTPELFDVRQLIYLSDQHRNPPVETLETSNGWVDLEARHGGLAQITAHQTTRLKRCGVGELPSIPANCSRNGVLGALREQNISGADSASLICGTCPLREPCTHANGFGYGYLNQRRSALSSPLLRAHPDSMPDPKDYQFDETLLVWDEFAHIFRAKQQLSVTFQDLQQTITALLPYSQLFEQVQPLLTALLSLLDGSTRLGRFGKDFNQLKELLPDLSGINAEAIAQALVPNLAFLNTTSDYGVDLADLPRKLRKKFSDRDSQMAKQAKEQVIKQWLPDLIRILQGNPGSVHLTSRGLTLTSADWRHRHLAQTAKGNVFLDGTLTQEELALKLGCSPSEIKVVRQYTPAPSNLEIVQVTDIGRVGMQRGGDQLKRSAGLINHYKKEDASTQVIDYKQFEQDGAWWRDSRGVNDFLSTRTLILVGTPCRNLIDLAAEFAVLTGHYPNPDDSNFEAFVERTILAEIHQAIGRLRAHRRPDEQLKVILISNLELDIPVRQVKGSEITVEAASKTERVKLAIQNAIQQLQSAGEKVTQKVVSAVTSIPRGTIARYWRLFISLVEDSKSKMNNLNKPSPEQADVNQAVAAVLEEVASLPSEQVLVNLSEVFFEWLSPGQWRSVWNLLSAQAQIALLNALTLTLPELSLQEFKIS